MRTCFLEIDGEINEYTLDLRGRGRISEGSECRARRIVSKFFEKPPWELVRIGRKIDHIGSGSNSGGGVYQAKIVRSCPGTKMKDRSEPLFGGVKP